MKKRQLAASLWPPLAALALLAILWQLAVSLFGIASWILPSPGRIAQEAVSGFTRMQEHAGSTIRLTLLGFSVGSCTGIAVACLLHVIPGAKRALYPLLIVSQNIPMIALAPLLMIWFGFGLLPKVIVITLVCFFPVVIATLDGFLQADPVMRSYMNMIGATRIQIFRKLEWPGALPSLFSGLKISGTYSVMGAVIAEWLGSEKGIGVYMLLARSSFRTDRVFVAIVWIVALSLVLFGLILLLERLLIRWKPASAANKERE
ncbi:nitrate ABC transporter permease [Paenibacillus sp. J31TS4]|uniref:ABC transporter permease n=1 Tax=Paenibacillus sp. J31TS4 TaxID=2807195 RepID=UPI001B1CE173|nr:ABC transporter permease [Paenibacillus sp. J31TS4]GIP41286.1 nitrate ABC transporter permease [Paenibacillus sp. J31TS4]